ncbi:beta family protein [Amycolatopsis circi]|uniref:beta family protein n=1 Tax=Amycolatopsis circi TaxID=871959 RepID=UPI001FC9DDA6|nr:beta family protein [Amycolatopsis circi]
MPPLVALKCKSGELSALRDLEKDSAPRVRFVVELLDSVTLGGDVFRDLIKAALHVTDLGRTLWIDTTWLTPASPLAQQPGGAFEFLEGRIESALPETYGLFVPEFPGLVPVVAATASDDELRRVRLLVEHRDRDVAIRVHHPQTADLDLPGRIRRIMRLTGARPGHVHAIVDSGFLETAEARRIEAAAKSTTVAQDLLGPATVTVLAGSIPAKRETYATTERLRSEVSLWNGVRQEGQEAGYGDYGVAHPVPPAGGSQARTPNPYLCYTVPRKTVILRRKLESDDARAEMFSDLVDELVERADFAGSGYSWGDHELARCRRLGGRTAASVPRWVSMATSHHLEHVARRSEADL